MDLNVTELADQIDPELGEFVRQEQIKGEIRGQIIKLNAVCFDKCVEKPGSKLEAKQESCIRNCIDRYIDSNAFIAERFAKRHANSLGRETPRL